MGDEREEKEKGGFVLVARKGCFGLPTACPSCLPVYLYLRFANANFDLHFDLTNPDSDHVPYVEYGDYVIYNNEKGGVIEGLKEEGVVDLDSKLPSLCIPELLSTKAMISSWLGHAALYELWMGSDATAANDIYLADLPWPISKVLHWKQTRAVKDLLGITQLNAYEKEEEGPSTSNTSRDLLSSSRMQTNRVLTTAMMHKSPSDVNALPLIYKKAGLAYEALSLRLGEQSFLFEDRPSSVDAMFLGHSLFVLHALPATCTLRSHLLKHDNLVRYSENLKAEYLESSSSSSSIPRRSLNASTSSTPRRTSSYWRSKPKPKAKREKTEEEKTFRRRAKYFLAAQFIAVLVFLTLLGGTDSGEMEDGDEDGYED